MQCQPVGQSWCGVYIVRQLLGLPRHSPRVTLGRSFPMSEPVPHLQMGHQCLPPQAVRKMRGTGKEMCYERLCKEQSGLGAGSNSLWVQGQQEAGGDCGCWLFPSLFQNVCWAYIIFTINSAWNLNKWKGACSEVFMEGVESCGWLGTRSPWGQSQWGQG